MGYLSICKLLHVEKRIAQKLVLYERLLVEGLIYDKAWSCPLLYQDSRYSHGCPCCIAVLKHSRIVDYSGIQALCTLLIDLISVKELEYSFRSGARITFHIAHITKALIGHMVVYTQGSLRSLIISDKWCESILISAVKRHKQIIGLVICLMLYSRCTIQEHEYIREFLKIYLNPLVRVIACNIVIHSKC